MLHINELSIHRTVHGLNASDLYETNVSKGARKKSLTWQVTFSWEGSTNYDETPQYISPRKIVKEESEIYRDVENECFTNDWSLHLIKLEASVLKKILWLSRVFSWTPPILHCLKHFYSPPKERSLPGGKSAEVSCKQAGPTWSFILAGEASSMMAKSLSNAAAFLYEGCTMTDEILMSCSWPSIWSKWCSPSRTYQ